MRTSEEVLPAALSILTLGEMAEVKLTPDMLSRVRQKTLTVEITEENRQHDEARPNENSGH